LVLSGCDNGGGGGSDDGSGGGNQFIGSWKCGNKTIEFKTDLSWTRVQEGKPDKDSSGTYVPSGTSALLTLVSGDSLIKMAYDGQTITINSNSFTITFMGETDTFTKVN
jgi:hypothetical protein